MSLALPPAPWIIGHRGVRAEITENTLAGLRAAVAQGADMVEMDVQLAADGVLVVFHDWDLQRLAGRSEVVESLNSGELDAVRVRDPQAVEDGARHPVPRLAEALDALPPELPLNLELKRRRAETGTFLDALERHLDRHHNLLISSFDWELLGALRARRPALALAPVARRDARALLVAGERLGAFSLHCRETLAGRRLAGAAAAAGRPLLAYTVNDAARARELLDLGLSGVFTDRPGRLRAELEEGTG